MSASDALERNILDVYVANIATTSALVFSALALSTADPGDDGAGLAEPVGNGYGRQPLTGATWNAASTTLGVTSVDNNLPIVFGPSTGSWGTITYFALFSGTTFVASGILTSAVPVATANIQVTFPANSFVLIVD